jgi:hypothetical protein
MSLLNEKTGIKATVRVVEINPVTKEVISEEIGENVICVGGADTLSVALTTGSLATTFDFMVISTDDTPAARASTSISPQTAVSEKITPTYDNTAPTSKTIWDTTFEAGSGATATWKMGMQSTDVGGVLWNEYVFSAAKDNWTNDLKITYTVSFAP